MNSQLPLIWQTSKQYSLIYFFYAFNQSETVTYPRFLQKIARNTARLLQNKTISSMGQSSIILIKEHQQCLSLFCKIT
jgi:hypothetical protein